MACSGGFDVSGLLPILINLLDIVLTIIGLIPAPVPIGGQVAIAADALTVVLNTVNGDPIGTVLSVIAVIPVAGLGSGSLKIIYKLTLILTYLMGSPLLAGVAVTVYGC